MKKFFQLLAAGAVLTAALLPLGVSDVNAANYNPGYTCYYRDISGSCLSYQTQNPYFFGTTGTSNYRSPYGNRQTYPFNAMFNARSTAQSPWDNRYGNNYYGSYRYEEDDDDNDYIDEDDDGYRYHNRHDNDEDGNWKWYFDEDDDTYNRYRYQSDDDYDDGYGYRRGRNNGYYEYEHTRYYCTGRDCDSTHIRY